MNDKESNLFRHACPEFRLVAACCRWPADAARVAAIHAAMEAPIRWPHVLFLAKRHGVTGLVAHALQVFETVPAEVRESLAKAKQKALLRNLSLLRTQVHLGEMFQANGIAYAILKGTPLAMEAYGSLELRNSRDIDLLVRDSQAARVDELLCTNGYRRNGLSIGLSEAQERLWTRSQKHYEYIGIESGIRLEVHWRTRDNRYLQTSDDPLSRCQPAPIAPGVSLPALEREGWLLELCLHGAGHDWFRLKWLADVAALFNTMSHDEIQLLVQRARERGLDRPVLQALELCRQLFDQSHGNVRQPPSRVVRCLTGIAARALLEEDVNAPTATADFVPKGHTLSRLLLSPGWRYKWEEVRLLMTSSTDWQQFKLPPKLQFLYPLLRVPLWVIRRWKRPSIRR